MSGGDRGRGEGGCVAVFHVAEMSGAALSLRRRLEWLATRGSLTVVVPGAGEAARLYHDLASVEELDYRALTLAEAARSPAALAARSRREVRAFRALIRERRPELVICVTAMVPAALVAARLERIPAIVHAAELLAGDPARSALARVGGRALARLTGALSAGIAACSETVAEQYRGAGAEVVVTYPPISAAGAQDDGAARAASEPAVEAARSGGGGGAASDSQLVAALGSITRLRGQDDLLRAMRIVRRAFPDARCVIAGKPFPRPADLAFAQELEALRARLGLDDAIDFIGETDDVGSLYAAADVVVNPVRAAESFGRVACEALAAGRPVVSSDVGAIGEVLRDEETALLVPPDRPAALADAILRLLRDPELASRLARAGRDDVRRRFGPDAGLEEFKRLVATVA